MYFAMELFIFLMGSVLCWTFLILSASTLGSLLVGNFRLGTLTPIENLVLSFALGSAAISTTLLFFGFFGALGSSIIWVMALVPPILWWGLIGRKIILPKMTYKGLLPIEFFAIGFIVVTLVAISLVSLYPPLGFDSNSYHLPAAKYFLATKAIAPLEHLRFPANPFLAHLQFAFALEIFGERMSQAFSFLNLIMIVLLLGDWTYRNFGSLASWLSVSLLLGHSLTVFLATTAHIDMQVAAFMFLAYYAFLKWVMDSNSHWHLICGLMIGFTCGVKYHGLYVALLIGAAFLPYVILRPYAVFSTLSLSTVIALPWYWHIYQTTGTPFFPLFADVFSLKIWSQEELQQHLSTIFAHGVPKTFSEFFKLPYRMMYELHLFHADAYIEKSLFILSILTAVFYLRNKWLRHYAFFALGFSIFWFLGIQAVRHFFPILPVLALLSGCGLALALRYLPGTKQAVITLVLVGYFIIPALKDTVEKLRKYGQLPINSTEWNRVLSIELLGYKEAMPLLDKDITLYGVECGTLANFTKGRYWGDFYGPGSYFRILSPSPSLDKEAFQRLKTLGTTHIIICNQRIWDDLRWDKNLFKSLNHSFPLFELADQN